MMAQVIRPEDIREIRRITFQDGDVCGAFSTGRLDTGEHVAFRLQAPNFCFVGDSEWDVADKGFDALRFYHQSSAA